MDTHELYGRLDMNTKTTMDIHIYVMPHMDIQAWLSFIDN